MSLPSLIKTGPFHCELFHELWKSFLSSLEQLTCAPTSYILPSSRLRFRISTLFRLTQEAHRLTGKVTVTYFYLTGHSHIPPTVYNSPKLLSGLLSTLDSDPPSLLNLPTSPSSDFSYLADHYTSFPLPSPRLSRVFPVTQHIDGGVTI